MNGRGSPSSPGIVGRCSKLSVGGWEAAAGGRWHESERLLPVLWLGIIATLRHSWASCGQLPPHSSSCQLCCRSSTPPAVHSRTSVELKIEARNTGFSSLWQWFPLISCDIHWQNGRPALRCDQPQYWRRFGPETEFIAPGWVATDILFGIAAPAQHRVNCKFINRKSFHRIRNTLKSDTKCTFSSAYSPIDSDGEIQAVAAVTSSSW